MVKYLASVDGKEFAVEVEEHEGDAHFTITVNGRVYQADLAATSRDWLYSLLLDGRSHQVAVDGAEIAIGDESHAVEVIRDLGFGPRQGAAAGAGGPAKMKAPIPGLVVGVETKVGDDVVEGQTLLIVEAMKMQMELKSPRTGRVVEVAVQPGQEVNQGHVLVLIGDPPAG